MSKFENIYLLIEDNDDDAFALTWTLRRAEITTPLRVVTDGKQAIDYLSGKGTFADRDAYPLPTLVFLDLKLPYLNGTEVLQWIRTQPQFESLPVVILSGSDEVKDHEQTTALGASHYLVKPASAEDLRGVIQRTAPPSA